jgi:hypothetical protein
VGGALAVLGGMLLEGYKTKRSERREHLRDIQGKVLRPLEQRVKIGFLHLLQRKQSNIELGLEERIRPDTTATEYSFIRREKLRITQQDPTFFEPISDALYECSKEVHYKEVISLYEALEADFNRYQTQCLEYVQSLADQVKREVGLPDEPERQEGPWIRAEALATHIYKRQCGYERQPIHLRQPQAPLTGTLELPDSSGAVINVAQSDAVRALDLVTRLERKRERVEELNNISQTLLNRSIALGQSLERLQHVAVLRGKCKLLKG